MRWGRVYFAVQAAAGAAWWVAVFTVPFVREATLGSLDPIVIAALDLPLFVLASGIAAAGVRWAAFIATGWTLLVALGLAGYATFTGEAGWGVLAMAAASGGSMLALCLVTLGRVPTEWLIRGPFEFRPADRRGDARAHLAGTGLEIVVFWGLFLCVIPIVIAWFESRWRLSVDFPPPAVPIGIAVLLLASALGIWAAVAMSVRGDGTPLPAAMPNRLVVAGPYRFVRNPMAVAGIMQGAAVGLILGSWLVVVYAVAGAVLWDHVIRPHEEADLEARFGDPFRRYRAQVRCWWPRLRPVAVGYGGSHDHTS
ncbi:isoprenylcysteine carboxylmethyltransferase family protein [Agromyces sp. LHK192]|uniref:methyltransferase family protein n=1 Tax=Agromyces sp. LHK192 TaxID=2498704 RepID=UPI000FD7C9D5|nr:isoprenylcysteine carboxylmethyltransferase family protein [Agromyces sp. LHK192]